MCVMCIRKERTQNDRPPLAGWWSIFGRTGGQTRTSENVGPDTTSPTSPHRTIDRTGAASMPMVFFLFGDVWRQVFGHGRGGDIGFG